MKSLSRSIPFLTTWSVAVGLMTVLSTHPAQAVVGGAVVAGGVVVENNNENEAAEQNASKQGAEVQNVTGTATYQVAGGPVIEIKSGVIIPEGAVINTSPGSSVDLFLGKGVGALRVTESSTLQIAALQRVDAGSTTVTETRLVLQKGEILGDVKKQSGGSTFAITLPDGEVSTTKGRFQVSNRALDNLADNAGRSVQGGVTQSTVRFTEGQGSFSKGGQVFSFNGAGEYNPGSSGVAPLAPEAKQSLAQQFDSLKSNTGNTGDSGNQFVAANQNSVQPQETPLSPTSGSSN
ncbi:MAG: hypothetical protein JNN07_07065 [Verrucomicrobiales bacterium]|nr:hypothetical protein [Verrucomicrobiales bacterium]